MTILRRCGVDLKEAPEIESNQSTHLDILCIEIFKRTGSIHKLQRAMGHSSLNVSLTYLRGLEIAELKKKICLLFTSFN